MPRLTITIGNISQSMDIADERVEGVRYLTRRYNEKNGTTLTPIDFMFQVLNSWAGDAVNQRNAALREAIFEGFKNASAQAKQEGLTLWNVQSP